VVESYGKPMVKIISARSMLSLIFCLVLSIVSFAQELQPAPSEVRVADKKFVSLTLVSVAAKAFDSVTTISMLGTPPRLMPDGRYCVATENNLFLGRHPSPVKVVAYMGVKQGLETGFSYVVKRKLRNSHRWKNLWMLIPVQSIADHTQAGIRNVELPKRCW
jgi:hypothetical protein